MWRIASSSAWVPGGRGDAPRGISARAGETASATGMPAGGSPTFSAPRLVVPLGSRVGWEAAVFDHFHAVVATICQKLGKELSSDPADTVGGSTFTYEVWQGHPLDDEVRGALARFRKEHADLRARVRAFNDENEGPDVRDRIIVYAGQSVTEQLRGESIA